MNILFLSLLNFNSLEERNIYTDLLREFRKHGHCIFAISPVEKKAGVRTHLLREENVSILRLKIGNIQKTNVVEKGISTVSIEPVFITAIKKYFTKVKFDLVISSTPPITFCNVMEYVKKRDNAKTYLLLKDIFPQNAVDIGMISKTGMTSILYKIFRKKEKRLYQISDFIGCMSQANVDYILKHNPEINPAIVEVCPNSIEIVDKSVNEEMRNAIRIQYNIPINKKVFLYGGNLGKPQGIDFLIKCISSQVTNEEICFLIIGDGIEYGKLERFAAKYPQNNVILMRELPKKDYDAMVGACDVGMIFLDHRFTIPNFPSRLLSYMQAKIPVLACTDPNTDIGKVIVEGGFGWWCESNDVEGFTKKILEICRGDKEAMGSKAYDCLKDKYTTESAYKIIMKNI